MRIIWLVVLLISMAATSVHGAPSQETQDRCTQYAQRAVVQYEAMTGHPGCKIGDSPRWQSNVDKHYNACLLLPEFLRKSEEEARDHHLQSCGGLDSVAPTAAPAAAEAPAAAAAVSLKSDVAPVQAPHARDTPSSAPAPSAATPAAEEIPAHSVTDCGPAKDPNLPESAASVGLPIRWNYAAGSSTLPEVYFNGALASTQNHPAIYLGFDERGSWLQHPDNGGKLYIWNGPTKTLVQQPQLLYYLPPNIVKKWKNQNPNLQYFWIPFHAGSKPSQFNKQSDPNLPCIIGEAPGITWSYTNVALGVGEPPKVSLGNYLGYNEQGSWLQGDVGGRAGYYVWNRATGTIRSGTADHVQVPADLLNPSYTLRLLIKSGSAGPPGPSKTLPPPQAK